MTMITLQYIGFIISLLMAVVSVFQENVCGTIFSSGMASAWMVVFAVERGKQ